MAEKGIRILWVFLSILHGHLVNMLVLFSGGKTAANMAFCLVVFQNLLDLGSQCRVDFQKSFRNILVDCGLAYTKFFRSCSDS